MNVHELADAMEIVVNIESAVDLMNKAATTIRQLQAENEILREQILVWEKWRSSLSGYSKQ